MNLTTKMDVLFTQTFKCQILFFWWGKTQFFVELSYIDINTLNVFKIFMNLITEMNIYFDDDFKGLKGLLNNYLLILKYYFFCKEKT